MQKLHVYYVGNYANFQFNAFFDVNSAELSN